MGFGISRKELKKLEEEYKKIFMQMCYMNIKFLRSIEIQDVLDVGKHLYIKLRN